MSKQQVVSIIVTIFNKEQYLRRCIDSILAQTWKNIEVVLVNDGSTDNCTNIIKEYVKVDRRICVVNKENGGLVDATVTGILESKGEYICFVDADDYIGQDFVSNFMQEIEEYDCVAMGMNFKSSSSNIELNLFQNKVYEGKELTDLRNNYLCEKGIPGISNRVLNSRCNKCYLRNVLLKIIDEYKLCKDITLGEDSIFTFLFLSKCKKIKALSVVNSYTYVVDVAGSMMKNNDYKRHIEKANDATVFLENLLKKYDGNSSQAYALYYFLIQSLIEQSISGEDGYFESIFKILREDEKYGISRKVVKQYGIRNNILNICWNIMSARMYKKSYTLLKK